MFKRTDVRSGMAENTRHSSAIFIKIQAACVEEQLHTFVLSLCLDAPIPRDSPIGGKTDGMRSRGHGGHRTRFPHPIKC
ncbi:hypothetical protein TNCV_2739571 [Trichonephila clavipes]|nr:hypothetical protein TNCV_2739571 [Trichonephila clavipes]